MELPSHQQQLWKVYLGAEWTGQRDLVIDSLLKFIEELKKLRKDEWHPWALDIARKAIDSSLPNPVRLPLFRSVLFPALHSALLCEADGSARWLAGLAYFLNEAPECLAQLPEHLRSEYGLLQEALRQDAEDGLAKRRLSEVYRSRFNHALHELPSGVLYGRDGATVEQCCEMLKELGEFKTLIASIGDDSEDLQLISKAEFHLPAYRNYLLSKKIFADYSDYLSKHPQN